MRWPVPDPAKAKEGVDPGYHNCGMKGSSGVGGEYSARVKCDTGWANNPIQALGFHLSTLEVRNTLGGEPGTDAPVNWVAIHGKKRNTREEPKGASCAVPGRVPVQRGRLHLGLQPLTRSIVGRVVDPAKNN